MNWEMYSVCGAHGICEADPYGNGEANYPNGTLRCLCDEGYTGDFCESKTSEIRVIDQTHPGLLGAIIICILLLGVAIVCAAVLCHKIRMKQIEETQGINHLSGGMLNDADDARLAEMKSAAMTMDIGSGGVQLQSVDTMIESDNNKNELLVDEDEIVVNNIDDTQDVVEEQAESEVNPGANDEEITEQ